jgi:hypothetical protein
MEMGVVRCPIMDITVTGQRTISTYIGTPISVARFSAAAIAIRAPSNVRVGCDTVVAVHEDNGAIMPKLVMSKVT